MNIKLVSTGLGALIVCIGTIGLGSSVYAGPPTRCPEARTISGECVNPELTSGLRKLSIANTQPKFSYTAPPHLPSEDFGSLIARDWNEVLQLFTYPPTTGAPPTQPRP